MASIASLVTDLVSQKPFLQIALSKGIINYAKLAEMLRGELLTKVDLDPEDVKTSAIMMALRRFGKSLPETLGDLRGLDEYISEVVLDHSKFTLAALTVLTGSFSQATLEKLHKIVDPQVDYLSITQGRVETTMIMDQKKFSLVKDLFNPKEIIQTTRNLASLTLKIPEAASDTPGVFYMVTKELFWDEVNIFEVVSTFTEMTFILKEDDIPNALKSVKKILK